MKDKRLYPNTVIFQTTDGKGVTYYNARVLEQIRDEIDQKQYDFMSDGDYNEGIRFGLMLAYQIIDKYK